MTIDVSASALPRPDDPGTGYQGTIGRTLADEHLADGLQLLLHGLHRLHAHGNDAVRTLMGNGRTRSKACQNNGSGSSKVGGQHVPSMPIH